MTLRGGVITTPRRPKRPASPVQDVGLAAKKEKGWLPFLDTYRTMCIAPPPPGFQRLLQSIEHLAIAA
jgi:hypothetical protein